MQTELVARESLFLQVLDIAVVGQIESTEVGHVLSYGIGAFVLQACLKGHDVYRAVIVDELLGPFLELLAVILISPKRTPIAYLIKFCAIGIEAVDNLMTPGHHVGDPTQYNRD